MQFQVVLEKTLHGEGGGIPQPPLTGQRTKEEHQDAFSLGWQLAVDGRGISNNLY